MIVKKHVLHIIVPKLIGVTQGWDRAHRASWREDGDTRRGRSPRGFVVAMRDKGRVVARAPTYNLYVISTRCWSTCGCDSGNSPGQVRTGALAGDLICDPLPAGKARRNYVEIVGRRSRYHSPFVSHRCDKSPGSSYPPRHLLPAPTPPAPVPVTRYPETFGGILYRRKSIRKGLF